jgi:hypothetical protein
MAVDVKFSICQSSNCKAINFTEDTGAYHVSTNPTGWGSPNELTSDAVSATLTITGPDGTVYAPINLLALSSFPKSTSSSYSIDATTLSSTMTSFADGFWEMTYAVTTATTTYTETNTFFFHCQIDACICRMIADLDACDCNCDTEQVNKVLQAKAFSDALAYAVGCGNLNGANDILASLKKLCDCC